VVFNKEREGEAKIVYYDKSINKRWGEEDKTTQLHIKKSEEQNDNTPTKH